MHYTLLAAATTLVYAAFAALAITVLSRVVLPVSRRTAVILALLPLCFTARALFTSAVFAPLDLPFASQPLAAVAGEHGITEVHNPSLSDVAGQVIPWHAAVRYALDHGQWPLWNPFILSGQVLAGAAQPAPYDPVKLVALLLPLPEGLTFMATAVLLVAGLGTFFFVRDLGAREEAALVGAAGFMFSSFMAFFLHWSMGSTVAWFPLVLLGARRAVRRPGLASAGLLTAALLFSVLAGHPESTLHVVGVGCVYGLGELLIAGRGRLSASLCSVAAAGVAALLLSAVYVLPLLEVAPQTVQHAMRSRPKAGRMLGVAPREAARRLSASLIPFAWGVPGQEVSGREHRSGWFNPWSSAYVGGVLLAPALYGLWRSRKKERWLILNIGLMGVLAGISAPGVTDLLGALPLFDMALNKRLIFVGGFATAVLAALGVDAWAEDPRDRWFAAMHLAVLVSLGVLVGLSWGTMSTRGLSAGFLACQALLELAPLALAGIVLFAVRDARIGLMFLLMVVLAQRTAEAGGIYPTLPRTAFYPVVSPLDALPRDGPPYRVVGLGPILIPNAGTLYGIEDPRGDDALRLKEYHDVQPLWSTYNRHFYRVTDLESAFLAFLNVRFALAPRTMQPPEGWTVAADGAGARLLESSRVVERVFVPRKIRVGRSSRRTLNEMAAVASPEVFARVAWISGDPELDGGGPAILDNGPGRVEVTREGLDLRVASKMVKPGWVVVSETSWKGWRVDADGRQLRLARANHAFLAFHLPAGAHTVSLQYRPRSFVVGRRLSVGAAIGLLAVYGVWFFGRRTGDPGNRAPHNHHLKT